MIDLSKLAIDELVKIRYEIDNRIYSYEDGYLYICNVNSYGRHWKEHVSNAHSLEELCNKYGGEDGVLNVYSTNPDLTHIHNYGDLMYVPSLEDYEKWCDHERLLRTLPEIEKEWEEWDNRENAPFRERPFFKPVYDREDLAALKKQLDDYDMNFIAPVPYHTYQESEE